MIYEALCFNVAQGQMNGAPNENRTRSCRFASLTCNHYTTRGAQNFRDCSMIINWWRPNFVYISIYCWREIGLYVVFFVCLFFFFLLCNTSIILSLCVESIMATLPPLSEGEVIMLLLLDKPLNAALSYICCRIHWLYLCRGVKKKPTSVLVYDTKQSDGEVLAVLEFWGMRSTPSLPLLPGPLMPRVVAPDRALSMD